MKQSCLICLLVIFGCHLSAQQLPTDSITTRKTAIRDADKSFRLNKTIRKSFRHKQLYSTSDLFKPNLNTTKNLNLLNDSNYVKVFRHTAFDDTVYQIKINRSKIIIIGAIIAGVAVVSVIVAKAVAALFNSFTSHLPPI